MLSSSVNAQAEAVKDDMPEEQFWKTLYVVVMFEHNINRARGNKLFSWLCTGY